MKLTQLRYFQGICRWGSLSRAARELHISQSVLSGTIKELEGEFGVLLFSRSGRGLVLTEGGSLANIARVEDGTLDAAVISCGEELPHSSLRGCCPRSRRWR